MSELPTASPVSDDALEAVRADVEKVWKRVSKRAPDDVRHRVEELLARAEAIIGKPEAKLADRLALARALEEAGAELRGRKAFEPTFFVGGRLAIIRAWETVHIRGAVDHLRVEQFFDRYLKRAELAFSRLDYFLTRAGLLQPKEKVKKPAWEQPYAQFEQYRELIWGKMKRSTTPPKPRPGGG